jgi:hypothetical protein
MSKAAVVSVVAEVCDTIPDGAIRADGGAVPPPPKRVDVVDPADAVLAALMVDTVGRAIGAAQSAMRGRR